MGLSKSDIRSRAILRVNVHAAISLYVCAAADVIHIATAIITAPIEKHTVANVIGVPAANLAVIVLVIWLAAGVRRGRRLGAAVGVLLFFLFGGILSVVVAIGLGYKGPPVLAFVQILFGITIVCALSLVIRAILRKMHEEAMSQR